MTLSVDLEQQVHGYQNGHGLLAGTIKLPREDQDLVDRLSDIAGAVRPSETFDPYLTLYPLPSEQHFVVARTWQDFDVPRAGCVLTRSAFVPMSQWETMQGLLAIVDALGRPSRSERSAPLQVAQEPSLFAAIEDCRAPEIVEALFLESRRPVVVFDSPDAQNVALRVVTALWPSRRRSFAACTWCLAPRKLRGRDFDLVFAPGDARSRFSDWSGRRIEASARPAEGRHRWTPSLVQAVFIDAQPTLASWDELGILASDEAGDEGALRLSLLWRELEAKAQTTPNAVLGMLDILSSHSIAPRLARTRLEPLVSSAIATAASLLPPFEAWRFYLNLLGKFPDKLPNSKVLRGLRHASEELARTDPDAAISILRDVGAQGRPIPVVLAAGIGDGLAKALPDRWPVELAARDLLRLLAYSRPFAGRVARAIADGSPELLPAAVAALEVPDLELTRRARRHLVPSLSAAEQAPLLAPLLSDVSPEELAAVVRTVGKTTRFQFPQYDGALAAAARDERAILMLRDAVLEAPPSSDADRFLLSALRLDGPDVGWLKAKLPDQRGLTLLAQLVSVADDHALQGFMRDGRSSAAALSWLLQDPKAHAYQIARLLRHGHLPVELFVDAGLQVRAFLEPSDRARLDQDLMMRALAELPANETSLAAKVLVEASRRVDPADLAVLLIPPQAPQRRLMANLGAILSSPETVRRSAWLAVDQLTSRLVARGTHEFDERAYVNWATLIEQARSVAPQVHLNASIEALAYALRNTRAPASALVVVAFPPVYHQLLASKGDSDFDFIPALLLLPLTFFTDWDRAKTARSELVDKFMESRWPPANLLLAALGAGIDQKVLRRVGRSRGGARYIDQIAEDTARLPEPQRRRVRGALKRFTENPSFEDWD